MSQRKERKWRVENGGWFRRREEEKAGAEGWGKATMTNDFFVPRHLPGVVDLKSTPFLRKPFGIESNGISL